MYDTLKPDLLTASDEHRELMRSDPTAVVSWTIFRENSAPYLELRRPFILGLLESKWKPTAAHVFIGLVHRHNMLQTCLTQNIDGL